MDFLHCHTGRGFNMPAPHVTLDLLFTLGEDTSTQELTDESASDVFKIYRLSVFCPLHEFQQPDVLFVGTQHYQYREETTRLSRRQPVHLPKVAPGRPSAYSYAHNQGPPLLTHTLWPQREGE